MTLIRYVLSKFFWNILKVQFGFMFLILTIDGVEQLRILSAHDAPVSDAVRLTLLRSVGYIMQIFPLVIMLASLATFLGLARSSELVISRAAGQSAIRILVAPVLATLIIGVVMTVGFNPIVAATVRQAESVLEKYNIGGRSSVSLSDKGIWLRQGDETSQFVIQAERASYNGNNLFQVRWFEFDSTGTLTRRIEAQKAVLQTGDWLIENGRQWRFDGQGDEVEQSSFDALQLPTSMTSDEILENFASPKAISFWDLPQFISRLESSGFSAHRQKLFYQAELARPILLVAMVLIGAGFSMRHARFGQTGLMVLIAVFSAFVLYALKSIAESLGSAQEIPILLAAWGPPSAGILLTLGLLLHLEDG